MGGLREIAGYRLGYPPGSQPARTMILISLWARTPCPTQILTPSVVWRGPQRSEDTRCLTERSDC
jgi:hypothetical protein